MARVARFRCVGLFEFASKPQVVTVEIDRDSGVITVRPLRRRKVYVYPLADAMSLWVRRCIMAEVAEKRRAKAKRRSGR